MTMRQSIGQKVNELFINKVTTGENLSRAREEYINKVELLEREFADPNSVYNMYDPVIRDRLYDQKIADIERSINVDQYIAPSIKNVVIFEDTKMDLAERLAQAAAAVADAAGNVSIAQTLWDKTRQDLQKAQQDIQRAQNENLKYEQDIITISNNLQKHRDRKHLLTENVREVVEDYEKHIADLATAQQKLTQCEQDKGAVEAALKTMTEERDKLKIELDNLKIKSDALEENLNEINAELGQLEQILERPALPVDIKNAHIQAAYAKYRALVKEKEDLTKERDDLKNQQTEVDEDLRKRDDDVRKAKKDWDDKKQGINRAINEAKEALKESYDDKFADLLKQLDVTEAELEAAKREAQGKKSAKEQEETEKWETEKKTKDKEAQDTRAEEDREAKESRDEEAKKAREKLAKEAKEAKEAWEKKQKEDGDAAKARRTQDLDDAKEAVRKELETEWKKIKGKELAEYKAAVDTLTKNVAETGTLAERADKAAQKFGRDQSEIVRLTEELRLAKGEYNRLKQDYGTKAGDVESLAKQYTDARQKLAEAKQKSTAAAAEYKQNLGNLIQQCKNLTAEKGTLAQKNFELSKINESLRTQLSNMTAP